MTKPDGILPTIKAKMPWLKETGIEIQHDGAPGHNGKGNRVRLSAAAQLGDWNINIITQPAQSPDLNKLDLCLFHSMAAAAERFRGQWKTKEAIIESIEAQWAAYEWQTLERANAILHESYGVFSIMKGEINTTCPMQE
jgi:hypothetical protein